MYLEPRENGKQVHQSGVLEISEHDIGRLEYVIDGTMSRR